MRVPLKKWLKVTAWLGAAGTAGLAAALVALSRPGVQRGLALEGLRRAGWSGDIREITVSYSGKLTVAGVALRDPSGRSIVCARASGRVSLGGFVFGLPHIHRLDAEGVSVDFASPDKGATAAATAPAVIVSPARWRISAATIRGRVILPTGAWAGTVSLEDCAFARGGRVVFDLVSEGARDSRVVGDARVALNGVVAGGDWRAVWRALKPRIQADFSAHPSASGVSAARCHLSADADAADVRAETPGGSVLIGATFPETGPVVVSGRWALRREAFLPWVQAGWPTGDSRGLLSLQLDPATFAGAATVSMQASATSVPEGYAGPRRVQAEAALTRAADGSVDVSRLDLSLGADDPSPALVTRASGWRLGPSGWRTVPGGESRAEVTASALPVAWITALWPAAPVTLIDGRIDGGLRLRPSASGALLLETIRPPVLRATRAEGFGYVAHDVELRLPLRAVREPSGRVTLGVHSAELLLSGAEALRLDLDREDTDDEARRWRVSGLASSELARLGGLPAAVARLSDSGFGVAFTSDWTEKNGRLIKAESAADLRDASGTPVVSARYLPGATSSESGWRLSFLRAPASLIPDVTAGRRAYGLIESGELNVSTDFTRVAVPFGGAPLVLRDFGWADADGCIRMAPTDATVTGAWNAERDGWSLGPVEIRLGGGLEEVLTGAFSVRRRVDGFSGDVRFSGVLPRLRTAFPALGIPALDSGRVHFEGRLNESGEAAASLQINDARLAGRSEATRFEATLESGLRDGVRTVRAPMRLEGASGVTSGVLNASAARRDGRWVWDGDLQCDVVRPADWAPLWLSPSPTHSRVVGSVSAPEAPAAPFWAGHAGALRVRVGEVRWGGETWRPPESRWEMGDRFITATLPRSVWHGATISGDAGLRFEPGASPYALSGELRYVALPSDVFFTSLSAAAGGWVAGDFEGALTFSAKADSVVGLRDLLKARLSTASSAGTVHMFRADNEALRMTGDIVDVAGSLAGDLGTLLGKRDKRAAGMADAVTTLRDTLAVLRYERCDITVERDEAGALEIPSFTLVSDAVRLSGAGSLSVPVGDGFFNRMATGELRVEARGEPAVALRALGRAESAPDADGWLRGPLLRYDGALDNLRNNLLNNLFRAISEPETKSGPEGR